MELISKDSFIFLSLVAGILFVIGGMLSDKDTLGMGIFVRMKRGVAIVIGLIFLGFAIWSSTQ